MLLLAAFSVFSPPLLSRLRDSLTLSGMRIEEVAQVPAGSSDLTTLDKLSLYNLSLQNSDQVLSSTAGLLKSKAFSPDEIQNSSREDSPLFHKLEWFFTFQKEFSHLLEIGLVPWSLAPLNSWEGDLTVDFAERIVCTDVSDFSRSFSLYQFSFTMNSCHYSAILDPEEQKLWSLSAARGDDGNWDNGEGPSEEYGIGTSLSAFGEYLELPSPITLQESNQEDVFLHQIGSSSGIQWILSYQEGTYFCIFFNA